MPNIFDLEQKILRCWSLKEDLDTIVDRLVERDSVEKDELVNVLMGLSVLHDIRCSNLFDTYEIILKQQKKPDSF